MATSDSTLPFYVALAGPTASGKTAAALAIAERYPVEIISVDSALVYRGMDIGSAKPSAAERARVRHHLIDIRDPLQAYSAAEFVRDASALIHDIHQRARLPVLAGGTMLYFKALADGLDAMPPANPALRQQLEQEAAACGWPAMHAQLAQVDPVTAQRLAPGDSQRIQRALEVFRQTGLPLSSFHRVQNAPRGDAQSDTQSDTKSAPPGTPDHLLISLEPTQRHWLHERIALRFEQMLHDGFLDEVRALRARGDLHPDLPSMRCVGYRQAWQALDDGSPQALQQWSERGIIATRQLAKRQITWLRSMPQRHAIACDQPEVQSKLLNCLQQALTDRNLAL